MYIDRSSRMRPNIDVVHDVFLLFQTNPMFQYVLCECQDLANFVSPLYFSL